MFNLISKKNRMKSLNKSIIIIVLAGIFLSMSLVQETDPIDILLKRTTDPKLKEQILAFKKGGYELSISYEKHDVEAIIKSAEAFLGTPHQMGGLTSKGIDCSGLVMVAHQQNKIMLPHDGNEQARYGKIILSINELERGDLVFFHSTYNTPKLITHSGIYLGNNQFIHTSAKIGVSVVDINSKYWADHFLFGTKL
jgi:murein DD-endopeptidase / murein LD-carboxypeptidase